jgi:hypothetical protein
MSFRNKRLLFYYDQFFTVKLGEKLYQFDQAKEQWPLLRSFLALGRAFLVILLRKSKRDKISRPDYRHLVYLDTINQRNAIRLFLEKMPREDVLLVLYEDLNRVSLEFSHLDHTHLPLKRIYGLALLKLPISYFLTTSLKGKYKSKINTTDIYINMALLLAAIHTFGHFIRRFHPASVTVVNDHNLFPLAWITAARQNGITSVYIQHASVSEVFPKLLSNVALLEGKHSLDTYEIIGNYAHRVKMVGIPRVDGFIGYKKNFPLTQWRVGICLKAYYSEQLIRELIQIVQQSPQVATVTLRPHPGAAQWFWDFVSEFAIPVSDSRKENPLVFLSHVDVLISGESTILLEAALMKIPTVYFDDQVFPFDLYGYVKNGIVTCAVKQLTEIPKALENINGADKSFFRTKYYCDTVGTEYENKSSEMIVDFYKTEL